MWQETSDHSSRVKNNFYQLQSHLTTTVAKSTLLSDTYAMNTIHKKVCLHHPRLGIKHGKKWIDRCPVCVCWDYTVEPQITNFIADAIGDCKSFWKDDWHGFALLCDERGWNQSDYNKLEHPEWYREREEAGQAFEDSG